ncbi:hypothetical protein HOV93_26300 [Planctomycetes bacterium FF15]|uniref:Uncharacterized protein n=1 Tax=Bremerella alba TaxID=980252 RepID=A0A7V8V683_9BACT|nr:hypothetical protein [Bremerella alba]
MQRLISFSAMALLSVGVFQASQLSDFLSSVTGGGIIYASPFIALSLVALLFGPSVLRLVCGASAAIFVIAAHYAITSCVLLLSTPGDPNIGLGMLMYAMPLFLWTATWLGYEHEGRKGDGGL